MDIYNVIRVAPWNHGNVRKPRSHAGRLLLGLLAIGLFSITPCSTTTGAEAKRPSVASTKASGNGTGGSQTKASDTADEREPGKQLEPVTASTRSEQEARSGVSTTSPRAARRLPRYFGKLDLVDDQREQIFRVQQHYQEEIERREIELAELRVKREDEVRQILSEQQRARLAEFEAQSRATLRQSRDVVEKSGGESDETPAVATSSQES